MIIDRIRWTDAIAFLALMVCCAVCLGDKEPQAEDPPSLEENVQHVRDVVDARRVEKTIGHATDTPEARRRKDEIVTLESKAASLAAQIRGNSKSQKEGGAEKAESSKLRTELDSILAKTFDLKNDLEHLRTQELRTRLEQLEQKIDRRRSMKSQIVERRARELIDDEETKWNGSSEDRTREFLGTSHEVSGNGRNESEAADKTDPNTTLGFESQKTLRPNLPFPRFEDPRSDSSSQTPIPSYKELATNLLSSIHDLEAAKSDYARMEQLRKDNVISSVEVEKAKRDLEFAKKKRQIAQDDYRAIVRDVEMQLRSAVAEFDVASKKHERLAKLRPGVVSQQALDEAERDLVRAQAPIERLKARYDLYKKAGEGLVEEEKRDVPASPAASFDILSAWGIRLLTNAIQKDELAKTKYRGGLRIVQVVHDSTAAKNGIQDKDILVGLDRWETLNVDNVTWIMNQVRAESKDANADRKVKFYIVRNNETTFGFLPLPAETPARELE